MDFLEMLTSGGPTPTTGRTVIGRMAHYAETPPHGRRQEGRKALPFQTPAFELAEGITHRDTVRTFKDFAAWCARIVPFARVLAAPTIIVTVAGAVQSVPSALKFTREKRNGSNAPHRIPNLLISSALTPSRRFRNRDRQADQSFDAPEATTTAEYGDEEMLRLIYMLVAHEADRIWPAEGGELKWSDRIAASLFDAEDESREDRADRPEDHCADAWVRFALAALDHPGIVSLALLDTDFHTVEFARIWSGDLGREIEEYRDPFWPR